MPLAGFGFGGWKLIVRTRGPFSRIPNSFPNLRHETTLELKQSFTMVLLTVEKVSKAFDGVTAVKDVSLAVEAGEIRLVLPYSR